MVTALQYSAMFGEFWKNVKRQAVTGDHNDTE